MEFLETDEGLHRRAGLRNVHSFNFGRRPDAQAMALTPDPPLAPKGIADREMEAVEFDVGVETGRERLHELCADERLGSMGYDIDDDGQRRQKRKKTASHPP